MQRGLAILACVVLLGRALVFLFFAPWQHVHPTDQNLVISTVRTPLWQHPGSGVRLDRTELIIEMLTVGLVSGILLLTARWLG